MALDSSTLLAAKKRMMAAAFFLAEMLFVARVARQLVFAGYRLEKAQDLLQKLAKTAVFTGFLPSKCMATFRETS